MGGFFANIAVRITGVIIDIKERIFGSRKSLADGEPDVIDDDILEPLPPEHNAKDMLIQLLVDKRQQIRGELTRIESYNHIDVTAPLTAGLDILFLNDIMFIEALGFVSMDNYLKIESLINIIDPHNIIQQYASEGSPIELVLQDSSGKWLRIQRTLDIPEYVNQIARKVSMDINTILMPLGVV